MRFASAEDGIPQGRRMVYMAQSVALAVLENLVHMSRQDFPTGYVRITATVPDDIAILSEIDLRGNRSLKDLSTRLWETPGSIASLRPS